MSDRVGNPKDCFSRVAAQMIIQTVKATTSFKQEISTRNSEINTTPSNNMILSGYDKADN